MRRGRKDLDPRVVLCTQASGLGDWPYVIMPDHVHFFCAPECDAKTLPTFVGSWKEWTRKAIKHQVRLITCVWQEEFFDHVLRSSESYAEKWNYVRNNPVRMVSLRTQMTGHGKVRLRNCACSRRR